MGPKPKDKKGKKDVKNSKPEIDSNEVVTELMKQVFEIQLVDIEKKIERIDLKEEELKSGTSEIEEKIQEFEKENEVIIAEQEQLLALKEAEKIQKREEMIWLSKEIKIRIEKHKKHIEELEERFIEMVNELTSQIEELEEEVRVLEDYKQNKDVYHEEYAQMERQLEEEEMQHQRNLFEIDRKSEIAKVRVKKELESRLLHLSIEFQQISQKKIGNPCHRVTQENKAITNELWLMKEELVDYQEKYYKSKKNMSIFKHQQEMKRLEKDKAIARTVIQVVLIKSLNKERFKLLDELNEYLAVECENKILMRKLKIVIFEIEGKVSKMEEVEKSIEEKIEETSVLTESSTILRKNSRRLQVLIRNSFKIAEEAMAVRLIPMGGTDDEKFMTSDAKIRLFKKRRDSVFQKKGKILQYLLEFLSKAQLKEEDKKLLKMSTETITIDHIDFSSIFGKVLSSEKDVERTESTFLPVGEEEKSSLSFGSDFSLPRSISEIILPEKISESETESAEEEGEFLEEMYIKEEEEPVTIETKEEKNAVAEERESGSLKSTKS